MSQTSVKLEENKMGTEPIAKLLITMSLPMIASMLVQALYNIVDSIYVSQLGETALTAVSLSYPFMTLMIAFGVGTGVGVNVLISRYLGAKNFDKVEMLAKTALLLPFLTSLIFTSIGLTLIPNYFNFQTDDPKIYDLGLRYLRIAAIFNLGSMYQTMFEKLLSSTGRTGLTMITQVVGAVINVILDPILIFGWLNIPAMGVEGAAIATVIGQSTAAFLGLFLNLRFNKELGLSRQKSKKLKVEFKIFAEIYRIAFPSIMLAASGAIMTYLMNNILIDYSSTANAIFGIYFNLQSFVFMPIFGLNNGMIPIVSYNFGAKKKRRIHKTMKISASIAVAYMSTGFLLFQFLPESLLAMFNANEEMLKIGVSALRIISWHFIFAGFSVIISAFCQALGYSLYSLISSLTRQILVLIPAAYILGKTFGLRAIWYAYPLAEVVSFVLSIFFFLSIWKREELSEKIIFKNDHVLD